MTGGGAPAAAIGRRDITPVRRLGAPGVWLFPVTYLAHLVEEYAVADGFVGWAERTLGVSMSVQEFVGWNAFAFVMLCVGAVLVSKDGRYRWIETAIAIAVLGNAAAHVVASAATWTYSPGLASGVALWGPIGILRGRAAFRASARRGRRAGVIVGTIVVCVTFAVMLASL